MLKYIVGSKEVKALGCEVFAIELEEGFSTIKILNKLYQVDFILNCHFNDKHRELKKVK